MNNEEKELQDFTDELLRNLKLELIGWHNKSHILNFYSREKDFEESQSAIWINARSTISKNLIAPTSDIWLTTKSIFEHRCIQKFHERCLEFDISQPFGELKLILSVNNNSADIYQDLEGITALFVSEANLYEFPLHNSTFLINFREDTYSTQLKIHKEASNSSVVKTIDFRKVWIIEETDRANKLIEVIDSDSATCKIIYTEKIICKVSLLSYLDYLKSQHSGINENVTEIHSMVNNFDSVELKVVYKYFKAGLVDKHHLSIEDLIEYIDYAFNKIKQPEKRFSLKNVKTKQKIHKVFHTYYSDLAGKPHGKLRDYAALLGDYFEGFTTENVYSNFS